MLKAWCMFDNHTFARVDLTTRDEIVERIKYLSELNKGMTLFVKDGDATLGSNGSPFDKSPFELYGQDASDSAIVDWADRVLSEVAFRKLMDA